MQIPTVSSLVLAFLYCSCGKVSFVTLITKFALGFLPTMMMGCVRIGEFNSMYRSVVHRMSSFQTADQF